MNKTPQRLQSVALVGMDGSGKSTQSALLRQTLIREGTPVVLIHPFGRKLLTIIPGRFTPQPSSQGWHTTPSPTQRLAALAELIDIGLYLWAAYIRCVLWALWRRRAIWLVSDRSFEDLLVKHQRRGTFSTAAIEILRRLVPPVDQTIWLQTAPGVAMERDQDFQAAYYEDLDALYQRIAAERHWQIVPTTGRSPQAVFEDVAARIGLSTLHLSSEQVAPHMMATPR
jgi:energy-coupling factor transporter ATP-binding protein EcfA2